MTLSTNLRAGRGAAGRVRLGAALLALAAAAPSHADVFDVASYASPAGWTVEDTATARSITAVDRQAGTFCRLSLYASTASTGDARRDFDADWQGLIAKPFKTEAVSPRAEAPLAGWQVTGGAAAMVWSGKRGAAALLVYSDGRRRFTVSSVGTADCSAALAALRASLVLPNAAPPPAAPAPAGATAAATDWLLNAAPDFVEARRGAVTVRLHHAAPIPDALRAYPDRKREYFWNTAVVPRYDDLRNVVLSRLDAMAASDWIAADGTERASGRRVHVVFHLFTAQGIVSGVEVAAPTAAEAAAAAPTAEQVSALRGLNRFAVQAAELPGRWSQSGSSFTQYVNAYTGANAGAAVQGGAYTIAFDAAGRFTSEFKGVSGFVGSLRFAQENRAGTWRLREGLLETTADDGKQRTFRLWFEAVRGGRVLHLQDTLYSGMHDVLVRR